MDVTFFPFDRQNCSMKFRILDLLIGTTGLRPHRRERGPEGPLRQRESGRSWMPRARPGPQARLLPVPAHQLLLRAAAPAPVLHALPHRPVSGAVLPDRAGSTCPPTRARSSIHLCPGFLTGSSSWWLRRSSRLLQGHPAHRGSTSCSSWSSATLSIIVTVFVINVHHRSSSNLPPHGPLLLLFLQTFPSYSAWRTIGIATPSQVERRGNPPWGVKSWERKKQKQMSDGSV